MSEIENTIFNDKRMEKYIDDYNSKFDELIDKNALNKWIEKLDNNELKSEKKNYLNFYDIIIKELLGYETGDIEFEENIGNEGHPVEFTIKKENKSFAIIEAKGTTYKDLTKRKGNLQSPVEQASNYASAKQETKWAIVTNYDEFRLFSPISRENYISFKFRQLKDEKILKKFLLIFSKFFLVEENIPGKLLSDTQMIEKELEDDFYELFSETRLMLIKEIQYTSENIDKHEAIRLAQLILNRYIFLCFAEDLRLIEEETTADAILSPIKRRLLFDEGSTICQRLNELFLSADKGIVERNMPSFNGGLFRENLDYLKIRDKIFDLNFYEDCYTKWKFEEKYDEIKGTLEVYQDTLNPIYKNLLIISSFDFGSEVDVDILGHIFEKSIGDIEELKNDDREQQQNDGIFYTPPYITEYICRNTIIPYLSKSGNATTVEQLISEYNLSVSELDKLDEKLKNIKIVDPACGSGAFLNKATDVLLDIHEYFHSVRYANNTSNLDQWFDSLENRRQILLNNIYGVDLNEESVEITKLSLFLKLSTTAGIKQGFKLPNLDKNIRCGNSLVSDKNLDEKAFNWKDEFKEVFDEGGFDIIVGNPPYIKERRNKKAFAPIKNSDYYQGKMDIWTFFGCISLDYVKEEGLVGFIAPSNWITAFGASKFRNKVNDEAKFEKYIDFGNYKVFDNADIQTMVYIMKKNNKDTSYSFDYRKILNDKLSREEVNYLLYIDGKNENYSHFKTLFDRNINKNNYFNFNEKSIAIILNKLLTNENITYLKDNEISQGIVAPQDFLNKDNAKKLDLPVNTGVFVLTEEEKNKLNFNINELELIKPYFTSKQLKRYITLPKNEYWIIYSHPNVNDQIEQYPHIKEHLDIFSDIITSSNKPYGLHRTRNEEIFKNEKIIVTRKCLTPTFSYANFDTYVSQTFNVIKTNRFDLNILLGILNSDLIKFWLKNKGKMQGNNYQLDNEPLRKIPIKNIENEITHSIKEIVEQLLKLTENFYNEVNSFNKWLNRTISSDLISIPEYYNLKYEEFLIELKNQNINVKQRNIQELIEKEFNDSIEIINPIILELKELEKELNEKIYELYNINLEDIEIIEKNLNN